LPNWNPRASAADDPQAHVGFGRQIYLVIEI
jgi:hypothetical protein